MRKLIFKRDGIGPGREVSKRMKDDWVAGYVMVDTISAAGCAKNLNQHVYTIRHLFPALL